MDKLFYDTHAKNVIVDSKEGRNLEDLISTGELSGPYDPARKIQIIFMSTVPNLETLDDPIYTYKNLGKVTFSISEVEVDFYMYTRDVGKSETIPSGTVVIAEYNNIATISVLGGQWALLGKMTLRIDNVNKTFFSYKKL